MSQSEVERFVADLKSDASLREDLQGSAAGVASVVEFAQSRGYDIGVDEARQYIQAQTGSELSDAELDHVAGGKGPAPQATITTSVGSPNVLAFATIMDSVQVTSYSEAQIVAAAVIN
jgi:predicted ribosomally synthesized peptide with nif11-like leader